jgi:porin
MNSKDVNRRAEDFGRSPKSGMVQILGIARTALNQNPTSGNIFFTTPGDQSLRSNQLMLEWYYQMKLVNGFLFQTAVTEIPNPGQSASIPSACAISLRIIALF